MFFVILLLIKKTIMNRTKAADYFHVAPEKLNCAQSILKAFQSQLNISEETIAKFQKHGGGRAPEGICGALFAADYLLKQQGKNSIHKTFNQKAGAVTCIELKRNKKIPCEMCVKIADKLLEEKLADF